MAIRAPDGANNDDDDDADDADVLIFCCFRSRRIRSCHFCFGLQSCLRSLSDVEDENISQGKEKAQY